jgi:hypothetical protein
MGHISSLTRYVTCDVHFSNYLGVFSHLIADTIFESRSDEFTVKVVEKPEDIKRSGEAGFEFYCQKDNLIFLRKRK